MPQKKNIEQAISYIKSNWKEGKNLKQVAEMYGLDPGNLARAFRNGEGLTVKAFIDGKRKEYVLTALARKKVFGHEIGTTLGFHGDLGFYRWVKRAFGVPLSTLRQRQADDKE